jgi:hypothetical protein
MACDSVSMSLAPQWPLVDEEGQRSVEATEVGTFEVVRNARAADFFAQVDREALDVELLLLGVAEVVHVERAWWSNRARASPRTRPGRRRLGCLGGSLRVHVDVGQRQMTPHVADVREVALQRD